MPVPAGRVPVAMGLVPGPVLVPLGENEGSNGGNAAGQSDAVDGSSVVGRPVLMPLEMGKGSRGGNAGQSDATASTVFVSYLVLKRLTMGYGGTSEVVAGAYGFGYPATLLLGTVAEVERAVSGTGKVPFGL